MTKRALCFKINTQNWLTQTISNVNWIFRRNRVFWKKNSWCRTRKKNQIKYMMKFLKSVWVCIKMINRNKNVIICHFFLICNYFFNYLINQHQKKLLINIDWSNELQFVNSKIKTKLFIYYSKTNNQKRLLFNFL